MLRREEILALIRVHEQRHRALLNQSEFHFEQQRYYHRLASREGEVVTNLEKLCHGLDFAIRQGASVDGWELPRPEPKNGEPTHETAHASCE